MKALLDGDIITYRCGFAAEHMRYHFDGQWFDSYAALREFCNEAGFDIKEIEYDTKLEVEPVSHALANVKSVIKTLCEAVGADEYCVFLSTGTNFRGEIATIKEYKANRKDSRKPVHYDAVHEYILDRYEAYKTESIEADDAMALCQTKGTVICSLDKDMLQVPGLHYNWVHDSKIAVSPYVGQRKLWQQVLTGDSTDNIPGIRGTGPVKARKIINPLSAEELYPECIALWTEYFETGDDWFVYKDGLVSYEMYGDSGVMMMVEPESVVLEVLQLLTVGGNQAYAALQKSGEEIPLPSEKERKAAWAARSVPLVAGGRRSSRTKESEGSVRVRAREDNVRGASDSETVHSRPSSRQEPGREEGDIHRDQGPVHGTGSEEDVADHRAEPTPRHSDVACEGQYDFEEQSDEVLNVVREA